MSSRNTAVEGGGFSFDVRAIGDWITDNIWLFLLIVLIAYIFFISRKDGLASKYLDYRAKTREIEASKVEGLRRLAQLFESSYGPDEPLLPFDRKDGKDH
ncbi:hypothetical protein HFP57_12610 [Parasphingopyxis algicola]|uniref:hypothetical protein n=1 Tax=Parasphingopyxis algicola TaxID=2026624 RepID=UPI0015A2BD4C|nr:hypothetical protein [Parasphingopyxis algicola]QLC25774.1 hypothetical protein HFP57_12610 [Parasphingopyxis algicola]